ncbi:hypothetical protein [Clostridium botulinum]|uniref:hypothetical protein n=1 Tax=Clostridium TaxID=1485 RepID=UPI00037F9C73|nr:hypothetical protein [Clostridium botulinum]
MAVIKDIVEIIQPKVQELHENEGIEITEALERVFNEIGYVKTNNSYVKIKK